ncbi:MAG: MAPEG family protein [Pseudomonadales bacterium]|nr:MAPEG family protein [Pseudomonadales bacterium]
MPILPIYAALFGLIFVGLSVRTLRLRHRYQVAVGPGEAPELQRAMRVHANFAEYVPLTLLLLYFLEVYGQARLLVHLFCLLLLTGRLLHAFGVSQVQENFNYRVTGMALTFVALIGASLRLLALGMWQ